MRRVVLVGVGVLLTLAGVIFTLQGVGVLGGSVMSGVTLGRGLPGDRAGRPDPRRDRPARPAGLAADLVPLAASPPRGLTLEA